MRITHELADFVVSTPAESIPDEVRRHVVRTMVNWVACALGGAHDPTVLIARTASEPFFGTPRATVIGHPDKVDGLHAALLNAISSHVLDFDDTHLETLVHPSGPVLGALLALAQQQPLSGKDFITAVTMGIEAECRIGIGLGRAHYDAGWHITSTAGVCGAAIAVGRALKLTTVQMVHAIGIAATQASGLREMFGSMCKSLHCGKAAQNGLSAALMAHAGFTSSDRPLEAPRGMAHVMSTQPDLERILAGLGEIWETSANTFKPYACGLVIHPFIDACRELAGQGLALDTIEEVVLEVHPLVVELTGKRDPANGLQAKFSVVHCAAATLVDGNNKLSHFSDTGVQDARIAALRDRVRLEVQQDMRPDEARAIVVLSDGTEHEAHIAHALGSLERPMSEADLSEKFHTLAEDVLKPDEARAVLQQLWEIEACADVADVAEALRGERIQAMQVAHDR